MFLFGNDCHRLGLDRIDYYHTNWIPDLSCLALFPDGCSVLSSASMSQSTDMFFTCNGRSLTKRLNRIGPKMEPCGTPYFTDSLEE